MRTRVSVSWPALSVPQEVLEARVLEHVREEDVIAWVRRKEIGEHGCPRIGTTTTSPSTDSRLAKNRRAVSDTMPGAFSAVAVVAGISGCVGIAGCVGTGMLPVSFMTGSRGLGREADTWVDDRVEQVETRYMSPQGASSSPWP